MAQGNEEEGEHESRQAQKHETVEGNCRRLRCHRPCGVSSSPQHLFKRAIDIVAHFFHIVE